MSIHVFVYEHQDRFDIIPWLYTRFLNCLIVMILIIHTLLFSFILFIINFLYWNFEILPLVSRNLDFIISKFWLFESRKCQQSSNMQKIVFRLKYKYFVLMLVYQFWGCCHYFIFEHFYLLFHFYFSYQRFDFTFKIDFRF